MDIAVGVVMSTGGDVLEGVAPVGAFFPGAMVVGGVRMKMLKYGTYGTGALGRRFQLQKDDPKNDEESPHT